MFRNKLHQLAELYGIQVQYDDICRRRVTSSDEALMATLRAMGCSISGSHEAQACIERFNRSTWFRFCEPVVVAWANDYVKFQVRITDELAAEKAVCRIQYEDGSQFEWNVNLTKTFSDKRATFGGIRYLTRTIVIPAVLPLGYHKLIVKVAWKSAESLLIVSPRSAMSPSDLGWQRSWGVFAPLYAAHSRNGWGSGTFNDLRALSEWVAGLGGNVVATLPLLASFLYEASDPSPYSPASKLFWNEFYLDIERIHEFEQCSEAVRLVRSTAVKESLDKARNSTLVDYQELIRCKKAVLGELARFFFRSGSPERKESFDRFVKSKPLAVEYAAFRAVFEKRKEPCSMWPARMLEGNLKEEDYEKDVRDYHLYVQWLAQEEISKVAAQTSEKGVRLYLDFPLGVNPDSFDVWRYRSTFALDARVGAPPDTLFTRGQDWGFPPMHPEKMREKGYDYFIACVRHHLNFGRILRVDHVMGLHRLFWIPKGLSATEGVYVRYKSEEFYAILCLESHRNKSIIVGENLGIVPPEVNASMRKRNIQQLFVLQYELPTNAMKNVGSAPRDAVASLNTHDIPPFAAYWEGLDIPVRVNLGILNEKDAENEKYERELLRENLGKVLERAGVLDDNQHDLQNILKACIRLLGASDAPVVLVNLEDLWLERQPQNIPSTLNEYPNWRRKMKHGLEEIFKLPYVYDVLSELNRIRKKSLKKIERGNEIQRRNLSADHDRAHFAVQHPES